MWILKDGRAPKNFNTIDSTRMLLGKLKANAFNTVSRDSQGIWRTLYLLLAHCFILKDFLFSATNANI
jgi:hypothetical protein